MIKKKKRYDPRDRWRAKYKKEFKLWIPSRKIAYLYWFKYLQLAELDSKRKVDWTKYDGWGGSNEILGTKFDDWWKEHWIELFGIKKEGDEPKFPLSTKRIKTDAIRYALRIYENRHRGSTWDIAIWLKKNEKRNYFLEFFGKIDENLDLDNRLEREEKDKRVKYSSWEMQDNLIIKGDKDNKVERDTNYEAYLNKLGKEDVQSQVGRYMKQAQTILNNVCKGQFP